MPKSLSLQSTKCGIPPEFTIALADATKFKAGINTSLFFFKPDTTKAKCKAEVPFTNATEYLTPVNLENTFLEFNNLEREKINDLEYYFNKINDVIVVRQSSYMTQ